MDDNISNNTNNILIPESPERPMHQESMLPREIGHVDQESETFTTDFVGESDNAQFNIEAPRNFRLNVQQRQSDRNGNTNGIWVPQHEGSNNSRQMESEVSNQSNPSEENSTTSSDLWRPIFRSFMDSNMEQHNRRQEQNIIISNENSENIRMLNVYEEHTTTSNENSNSLSHLPRKFITKSSQEEPPAKMRKFSSPIKNDDMDGETCPICLESWGTSGEHRLVSLKCGHLFGAQCVKRWLSSQVAQDRTCPSCKSKATLKDIRFIYARKLVAVDTSQITAMQKQIDNLRTEKSRIELELHKSKIAQRASVLQLEVLRNTLLKDQVKREQSPRKTWRFALEKNLEISRDGGCRVLSYNCRTYEFYVSQKSSNNLFPGYGIRKVNCIDYKLGQFMYLHPKPIRDMTYSQPRDLLLSVSLDSTVRIVERGVPTTTIHCGMPLWSVSWDFLRSNEFYVGGVGGVIHHYDIRNHNTCINRLDAPGDMSPVVSLCSTEYGLLSCQLNSCWLWVINNLRTWEPRALPVDGPFMSLSYDNESHRALVACRPGNERSRLSLCKLKNNSLSGETLFDIEQTFAGSSRSTLMSRSAWVRVSGSSWIAAHSESDSALYLHGLDGAKTMFLSSNEPALDVCAAHLNGDTVLAALSDSRLRLYKALPTNS